MKLRTKIEVTYNAGVTGQETGIVEGYLENTALLDDFNTVGANYIYAKPVGEQVELITKGGFTVEGEQADQLYNAIKGSIPEGLEFRDTQRYTYYLAFVYEMANTFGIETTDIEIVL